MSISIKIKNYKCFSEETGFDSIKRVNVIIGRNNSGKSSLLDIISAVTNSNYNFDRSVWRENSSPEVIFESTITEEAATRTFPANTSGGSIHGPHSKYGQQFVGKTIKWEKTGQDGGRAILIFCDDKGIKPKLADAGDYGSRLSGNMPISIQGKTFKLIAAERDIIPESDNGNEIIIHSNGTGVTHAIQCFINRSNLPSHLIERNLLSALNKIFAHDAKFTDIVCQLHDSNNWEIYLEEEHKGRIALSKSGSGLKTVIMVLVYLHLIPYVENQSLNNYIFAFEELENNIHPSLLRRLNEYIYDTSNDSDFSFFVTTHSNVLIDQFSKQEDAQIIHVTHENGISICNTAKTYIDNNGILDDLDVRASDILQSNGVIWVEGPSDRVYLNRWIELWSNGELREGTHYQILIYGGRLLSHLSAEIPELVTDSISILQVNRKSIILIDSDKRNQQAPINTTKTRIVNEFDNMSAIAWVTKGKEIENYIPKEAVDSFFKLPNTNQVTKYGSFFDHIDSLIDGEGKKYFSKKSLLSEKLITHMTLDNLRPVLDLNEKMNTVCERIASWNN